MFFTAEGTSTIVIIHILRHKPVCLPAATIWQKVRRSVDAKAMDEANWGMHFGRVVVLLNVFTNSSLTC